MLKMIVIWFLFLHLSNTHTLRECELRVDEFVNDSKLRVQCGAIFEQRRRIDRIFGDIVPPTAARNVSRRVQRDIELRLKRQDEESSGEIVTSLSPSKASTITRVLHSKDVSPTDPTRTYFDMSEMLPYQVSDATLFFKVHRPTLDDNCQPSTEPIKYRIHIYEYSDDGILRTKPIAVAERLLRGDSEWTSMDVSTLVGQWASAMENNKGIMVRVRPTELESCTEDMVYRNEQRMFIEMQVREMSAYNTIVPNDCVPGEPTGSCCRYPLEINFEAIGYDWIVAPKRYNAYYCAGSCKAAGQSVHPYSHIVRQSDTIAEACCSPKDLVAMTVAIQDNAGNTKVRTIPNMIVNSCGCT